MDELRIIFRKPVTFTCRVVAGVVMVLAPLLDSIKDKSLSDVSAVTWIVMLVAVSGAAANTAAAWFSSSATKARDEIQSERDVEVKP